MKIKHEKMLGYVNVFSDGGGMYTGNRIHHTKKDAESGSKNEKVWETDIWVGTSVVTVNKEPQTKQKQLSLWT
jgi:hypothetical protein